MKVWIVAQREVVVAQGHGMEEAEVVAWGVEEGGVGENYLEHRVV